MAEQIQCSHCGQTYQLTPEQVPQYAGQTITCTNCQRAFTVPREIGGAAAQAPPPQQAAPQQTAPMSQPVPGYPHPAAAYPPPQQPPPTGKNGMATASLVFSLLGLTILPIIGSIVGIILGFVGLSKAKEPGTGGRGLAVAGLSVGFASFFLWGILGCMISILLPSLNRARETANRVKCASNLRQIGQAQLLYANDSRGQLTPDLETLLITQPIAADDFICPSSVHTVAPGGTPQAQAQVLSQHCSYIYIPGLNNAAPADAVIAYEPLDNHDGDGANFLFGDGHVEWVSEQAAEKMIEGLEAGQNPPSR